MRERELKCKDLMIGDWVHNSHGIPMQICGVGEDYAYATFEGNEGDPWEFDDKDDKPYGIEITKEFLDNNGFRFDKDYGQFWRSMLGDYYFKSEYCVNVEWLHNCGDYKIVYVECIKRSNGKESGVTLKEWPFYVHDLQHALRLVGLGEIADNLEI